MRGPSGTCRETRPSSLAPPPPPNLDRPLLVTPESPVWTLRFLMQRVNQRLLGPGSWVWVDEGGVVHLDKPMRVEVVRGWWGWEPELPGRKWGETRPPPPPEKGVKMFELAQHNLFTPEKKKGGAPTGDSLPCDRRRWDWGGWSLWGGPERPTGGRTPDWCTASPPGPSRSPSSPQPPQLGTPRSGTPPNP